MDYSMTITLDLPYDQAVPAVKAALEQALAQERRARQARDDYLDRIAHQYRTPLAIIKTQLKLLGLQPGTATLAKSLDRLGASAARLDELFDQALRAGDDGGATRGQRLDNRAGTLGTQKGDLSVRSGAMDNQGGRVQSAADLAIYTAGQDIDNRATAGSDISSTLTATSQPRYPNDSASKKAPRRRITPASRSWANRSSTCCSGQPSRAATAANGAGVSGSPV